ncbi:MAG TPA: hypothetical protein VLM42_05870 [Bryobacteraceae bacterium]|nr:hypothetical protein [Bryobacteraceae bacterium]
MSSTLNSTGMITDGTLPAMQPVDPHLLTKNSVVDPAQDRQDLTLLRSIARGGKLPRSGLAENRQCVSSHFRASSSLPKTSTARFQIASELGCSSWKDCSGSPVTAGLRVAPMT